MLATLALKLITPRSLGQIRVAQPSWIVAKPAGTPRGHERAAGVPRSQDLAAFGRARPAPGAVFVAGHHRTAMEPGPDRDAHPKVAVVVGRAAAQSLHRVETRFEAARRCDAVLELPGRDELVADIAMDLA